MTMGRDRSDRAMKWPERHGFVIGGYGPCYVLQVIRGSPADKQGLKIGDKIIELDNHPVEKMAAPALESFAKHINMSSPTIRVINEVQRVEIVAVRSRGFGLSLQYSQRHGCIVESVDSHGPARGAGLEQGDLVLEVNGEPVYEKPKVLAILQNTTLNKVAKITLSVLAIKTPTKHSANPLSTVTNGHNRRMNKNVRHLRDKINSLFSENYEKRMALIGVLKTYAETGNAEKLAKSLVTILQNPSQRKILPYIRLYVPIRNRPVFDYLVQRSVGKSYSQDRQIYPAESVVTDYSQDLSSEHPLSRAKNSESQSSLLYLRSLVVHKGSGDTGVILRGQEPVVVEAVLSNTAAERAGVAKGDRILKINGLSVVHSSHKDLQVMMRNCGPTMRLEVMQPIGTASAMSASNNALLFNNGTYSTLSTLCARSARTPVFDSSSYYTGSSQYSLFSAHHHQHVDTHITNPEVADRNDAGDPGARASINGGEANIYSTLNSHTSAASSSFKSNLEPGDSGPGSYRQQVTYLLDKAEKKQFNECRLIYKHDRNIARFIERVDTVLDTPAKQTLWSFILPKLSTEHREFALRTVTLPDSVIAAAKCSDIVTNGGGAVSAATSSRQIQSSGEQHTQAGSSSALSHKSPETSPDTIASFQGQLEFLLTSEERKEVKTVLEQYNSNKNVEVLVDKLNSLLDTQSKKSLWIHILTLLRPSHQKYVRKKIALPHTYLRGEVEKIPKPSSSKGKQPASRRNRILSQSDDEFFVVGDDVERAAVLQNGGRRYESVADEVTMLKYETRGSHSSARDNGRLPGSDYFMQNPLYGTSSSFTESQMDVDAVDARIPAYDTITLPRDWSNSYRKGRQNAAFVENFDSLDVYPVKDEGYNMVVDEIKHLSSLHSLQTHPATDDAAAAENSAANGGMPDASYGSDQSFAKHKRQALEALDEAVAGLHGGDTNRSTDSQPPVAPAEIPIPPPPPPPPPPPLPPAVSPSDGLAPLRVKRLNWVPHRPDDIGETVWGQWKSDQQLDLTELLDSLELPQQFSTEQTKSAPLKKQIAMKTRKKIFNEKKAFNTSIVLQSLNVPSRASAADRHEYVESALLRAEIAADDTEPGLTSHVIQQLLQFAPDDTEEIQFENFDGDLEELSEVDRFGYRMTRLPGYKDRLRSFLFKATFDEKCAEVQKQLHIIKAASDQIRESERFARILKFILDMGNNLNKARNKPIEVAFKLSSLTTLDCTKTQDRKKTFLDVLVQAIHSNAPELLTISQELDLIPAAEKATVQELTRDISELQNLLQRTSDTINHLTASQKHYSGDDRFQEVMEHFVSAAEDKIQQLVRLRGETSESFDSLLRYLGETPNSTDSRSLFNTIQTFLKKYDISQSLLMSETPRSPTSDVYQYMNS